MKEMVQIAKSVSEDHVLPRSVSQKFEDHTFHLQEGLSGNAEIWKV